MKIKLVFVLTKKWLKYLLSSRAGTHDICAHLSRVEIISNKSINNSWELRLNEEVASGLKPTDQLAKSMTNLFDKVNNLLLSGITGDEFINVGDNVNAQITCELIFSPH